MCLCMFWLVGALLNMQKFVNVAVCAATTLSRIILSCIVLICIPVYILFFDNITSHGCHLFSFILLVLLSIMYTSFYLILSWTCFFPSVFFVSLLLYSLFSACFCVFSFMHGSCLQCICLHYMLLKGGRTYYLPRDYLFLPAWKTLNLNMTKCHKVYVTYASFIFINLSRSCNVLRHFQPHCTTSAEIWSIYKALYICIYILPYKSNTE